LCCQRSIHDEPDQRTNSVWYRYWNAAGITRRSVDASSSFGRAYHQAVARTSWIHFTLDGIPDVAAAVQQGKAGFFLGNYTHAELHYLSIDATLLAKTTFYRLN
jgi:hypothetical protein